MSKEIKGRWQRIKYTNPTNKDSEPYLTFRGRRFYLKNFWRNLDNTFSCTEGLICYVLEIKDDEHGRIICC